MSHHLLKSASTILENDFASPTEDILLEIVRRALQLERGLTPQTSVASEMAIISSSAYSKNVNKIYLKSVFVGSSCCLGIIFTVYVIIEPAKIGAMRATLMEVYEGSLTGTLQSNLRPCSRSCLLSVILSDIRTLLRAETKTFNVKEEMSFSNRASEIHRNYLIT